MGIYVKTIFPTGQALGKLFEGSYNSFFMFWKSNSNVVCVLCFSQKLNRNLWRIMKEVDCYDYLDNV
jgi:hypothetical protein